MSHDSRVATPVILDARRKYYHPTDCRYVWQLPLDTALPSEERANIGRGVGGEGRELWLRLRRAMTALAMLVAIATAGCQEHGPHQFPSITRQSWRDAGLTFTVWTANQPPQLDAITITVSITDGAGHSVPGCMVTVNATMPTMAMPANTTPLEAAGFGEYTGDLRYTMPGRWIDYVDVEQAGRALTDHAVSVTVK
jgi:hypothetical protein